MEQQIKIEDAYATETRKARRKGTGSTQEYFTPTALCNHMLDKLSPDTWTDFSKTILEPSAGNYNFVVLCLERRLKNCKNQDDVEKALSTIYSCELMEDNTVEGRNRLYNIITVYGFEVTKKIIKIIEHNNVCSDFFKWNFENWKPIEEDKPVESIELF